MLKALKILKKLQCDSFCDEELDEAIKELEELENGSCDNCIFGNQCTMQEEWERICSFTFQYSSPFYCNKWEKKRCTY